jgi:hypothetical protein
MCVVLRVLLVFLILLDCFSCSCWLCGLSSNNGFEAEVDVAFEGKVLCRYGNWDSSKDHKYPYLHCDLIDRAGFTTITVSLRIPHIETT